MSRILTIEDEEKTAASLRQGLLESGFDVNVAGRGDEGLLRARGGGFDLVVLDIMLPRRTGWEVLASCARLGIARPWYAWPRGTLSGIAYEAWSLAPTTIW